MFGSVILDVAIGLILVFTLLSLIASAVREGLEGWLKMRSRFLERGIAQMLGETWLARLYEHPQISALYPGSFAEARAARDLPSYIPSRNFARAVFDLTVQGNDVAIALAAESAARTAAGASRVYVSPIASEGVKRVVLSAIDLSGGDLARVHAAIAQWFDSTMERVAGRYKRSTAKLLLAIGMVIAVAANVDAIRLARSLYGSPAIRQAAVALATTISADTATAAAAGLPSLAAARQAAAQLEVLPIGWPDADWQTHWLTRVIGWLMTACAISLGAPFWFDLLSRIMVVRSTVRPNDERPEPLPMESTPLVAIPYEASAGPAVFPHEWATGQPRRGIL